MTLLVRKAGSLMSAWNHRAVTVSTGTAQAQHRHRTGPAQAQHSTGTSQSQHIQPTHLEPLDHRVDLERLDLVAGTGHNSGRTAAISLLQVGGYPYGSSSQLARGDVNKKKQDGTWSEKAPA